MPCAEGLSDARSHTQTNAAATFVTPNRMIGLLVGQALSIRLDRPGAAGLNQTILSEEVREREADLRDEHHPIHVRPRYVVFLDGEIFRMAQHQIADVHAVHG